MELTPNDYYHLKECVKLATEAFVAGNEPFGSVLVNSKNEIIARARNQVNTLHVLSHPEIELAYWAIENLSIEERRQTVMYTSGEHCPMCAAAHGLVEFGGLIYLSSAQELSEWLKEFNGNAASINFISSRDIIKETIIKGPGIGILREEIKALHQKFNG